MERDFLIITHDDHRNFRSRADLGHLIHRLQRRDGGFVIHGDDHVVGADPGLRRWTVRGHIVNDDPLNLIDPSALRVQGGDVVLESTGPQGACFAVRLPVRSGP